MAIQLSPGVSVAEIDLTTIAPTVATSIGAFAGNFIWGPANIVVPMASETDLISGFGAPNSNTYVDFFTAASFLAYGNNLRMTRVIDANTYNATASGYANTQIANETVYNTQYLHTNNSNTYGPFAARYAGAQGNSIAISVFDNPSATNFSNWTITIGTQSIGLSGYFSSAPSTSTYVQNAGGANDEFHMVVLDATGFITGTKGTILETYPFLSKALDAIDGNGASTYYKNVILNKSRYVYAMDPVDYANTNTTWGKTSTGTTFNRISTTAYSGGYANFNPLLGGTDASLTDSDYINGYSLFNNADNIDVGLFITGGQPGVGTDVTVAQYINDNITTSAGSATGRAGDSLLFLSPPYSSVVNNAGSEVTGIQTWLTNLARSSSYVVVDSGWKYMYDKYNNTYRWIPLNGDIAGLCVYTSEVRDDWYSPAGFNRGNIKNVVKLAWNPNLSQRNIIYPLGVNPVVTFPGNGTVLYGDKTLQSKPSAFDRINVRRLFIALEKSISLAAKFSLFEFNDSFTQAQFVALVTPFLRQVQGRRGITDFKVVCDSTNNTSAVVDANQFVGSIFVKPARSINYIQLNFVAVGTGVNFSEVVGAV
jgi:phage tail sheath protein FI